MEGEMEHRPAVQVAQVRDRAEMEREWIIQGMLFGWQARHRRGITIERTATGFLVRFGSGADQTVRRVTVSDE
jgi:hypothetical protein